MFWARADALAPLLNSTITYNEFEVESGKTDGTLNHVIERNLSHIALAQGLPIAVLQNTKFANAYP
jgi:lipopolysaccharide biosynthesis protein